MAKLLNEWLFAGLTAATALMSVCALEPGHPLAASGRLLGYTLALFCLVATVAALWLRQRRWQRHR
jgi:hypothetical protein